MSFALATSRSTVWRTSACGSAIGCGRAVGVTDWAKTRALRRFRTAQPRNETRARIFKTLDCAGKARDEKRIGLHGRDSPHLKPRVQQMPQFPWYWHLR